MSSIGNWAYVNRVVVRPFIEYNSKGQAVYGAPYEIKCYYGEKTELIVGADGADYITTGYYLTEKEGIKTLDLVGGKPAQSVQLINSTPFGETNMDYKIWV